EVIPEKRRMEVGNSQSVVQGRVLKSVVKRNEDYAVEHRDSVSKDKVIPAESAPISARNLGPSSCNNGKGVHFQLNANRDVEASGASNDGTGQFVT
ncbi:hypothetical protein K0M31_017523, partial [Melipona bicolor]